MFIIESIEGDVAKIQLNDVTLELALSELPEGAKIGDELDLVLTPETDAVPDSTEEATSEEINEEISDEVSNAEEIAEEISDIPAEETEKTEE